ncbi:hypothetical protein ABMA28_005948 [Loxostege sticticalis]|uniref:Peptidase aspartic putative domain-containing protein n=1 Tax=Loxostege sticticalis TaxID=481309 RepID=A0ABD0SNF4_LOXSC
MDSIINLQRELQKAIGKAVTNYNKSPKDRITPEYLETRLENLDRDWQSFHSNHSKLYQTCKIDEISASSYHTDEVYDHTEDTYIQGSTMKAELNRLLILRTDRSACVKSTNSGESKSNSSFVKLPKISIPTFSGNYSEWPTFRDLFVSLVDKNSSLDNVQKLHYLKGQLSGEAEQLIRHTPITADNYDQCWDLLVKRYNNKRYLANCILKKLFSQKRLNFESASGLKELLDNTSECLSSLNNLGVQVSTWDIIIIHIVTFKLDDESRKQWELHISGVDSDTLPTLDQLKDFLENRFRALEFVDTKKSQHNVNQTNPKAFLATNNGSSIRCEFCREVHKLCFCKKFAKQDYESRREFVVKNRMCFNCLGGNHTVYECKSKNTCKICKKHHHSLLHKSEPSRNEETLPQSPDKDSSTPTGSEIVSCLSAGGRDQPKQILLPTALVNVESRTGDFQGVRALIDQGSQACFITESTVQRLGLKKKPGHGTVSRLGEDNSVNTKGEVNITVQSTIDSSFKIPIKALVLDKITSYLPETETRPIDWKDLKNLPLADRKFNTSSKIDLLIGAEVYSYIIKEGVKKSPSGSLIAQNTTLGWIISGIADTAGLKNHLRYFQAKNNATVMHSKFKDKLNNKNKAERTYSQKKNKNIRPTFQEDHT